MNKTEILQLAGTDLGYSEWFHIDQERVNQFSDVTIDHQFIHLDAEAAAATPFGGTIVQGFLTLSLLVHLVQQVATRPDNLVMSINYGFNKVRFLNPVLVGSDVRAHVKVVDVAERGNGQYLVTQDVTVEIEGLDKPALVAQWLSLLVTE